MAAPLVHPRLAAVDLKAEADVRLCTVSDVPLTVEEWTAEGERGKR